MTGDGKLRAGMTTAGDVRGHEPVQVGQPRRIES